MIAFAIGADGPKEPYKEKTIRGRCNRSSIVHSIDIGRIGILIIADIINAQQIAHGEV